MAVETTIDTARLRIRCYREDDLHDLVVLANDWEVARWVGNIPYPYTETVARECIGRVKADHTAGRPLRFAIAMKEDDRLIGGIGLDGRTGDGSAEPALGYWIGQPYWVAGSSEKRSPPLSTTGSRPSP